MSEEKQLSASDQAKADDLLREIREIWAQYKQEVPKKRRPWPRSIKERVAELWRLRVSTHTIGVETGLPVQTMYSLRRRLNESDPAFLPVPIVKQRQSKNGPALPQPRTDQSLQLSQLEVPGRSPVTAVVREGIRIEGLTAEQAVTVVRSLLG